MGPAVNVASVGTRSLVAQMSQGAKWLSRQCMHGPSEMAKARTCNYPPDTDRSLMFTNVMLQPADAIQVLHQDAVMPLIQPQHMHRAPSAPPTIRQPQLMPEIIWEILRFAWADEPSGLVSRLALGDAWTSSNADGSKWNDVIEGHIWLLVKIPLVCRLWRSIFRCITLQSIRIVTPRYATYILRLALEEQMAGYNAIERPSSSHPESPMGPNSLCHSISVIMHRRTDGNIGLSGTRLVTKSTLADFLYEVRVCGYLPRFTALRVTYVDAPLEDIYDSFPFVYLPNDQVKTLDLQYVTTRQTRGPQAIIPLRTPAYGWSLPTILTLRINGAPKDLVSAITSGAPNARLVPLSEGDMPKRATHPPTADRSSVSLESILLERRKQEIRMDAAT